MGVEDLPKECLTNVLSFLSYDDVSHARLVCRTFDVVCKQLLNVGFARVSKFHDKINRNIKSQLPRRESARRTHKLSRHSDIVMAIETRINLLSTTYQKYIDNNLCCFIPGKVLDEMFRVLRIISNIPKGEAPKSYEFLRELRDISSMAMEHFEENIEHGLCRQLSVVRLTPPIEMKCSPPLIEQLKRQIEVQYKKEMRNLRATVKRQQDKIDLINKQLLEHNGFFAELRLQTKLSNRVGKKSYRKHIGDQLEIVFQSMGLTK